MNIIYDVFPHYLEPKSFAQCRSCFTPMLGILRDDKRKECHGCLVIAKEMYGVDIRKCRGL